MGPLADIQGPGVPQRLYVLKTWVPGQTLSRKMFKIIFQRIFMLRNIFGFFVKNRKVLEKVSSMHECFENSNMQWEKSKKSRKVKWWKVNMRYVPIYLPQGLVVLSLTSGTFLLL